MRTKSTTGLKLDTLQRIILYVKDAQASAKWYHKTLGIPIQYAEHDWAELGTQHVSLSLHSGRTRRPSPEQAYVGFRVKDFDAAYKALKVREVKVSKIFTPCEGTRCANFSDPDGNALGIEGK